MGQKLLFGLLLAGTFAFSAYAGKVSIANQSYEQGFVKEFKVSNNQLLVNVVKITADKTGKLYALTSNGIVSLNSKTNKWIKTTIIPEDIKTKLKLDVTGVIKQKDYTLIASNNGLEKLRSDGKIVQLLKWSVRQLAQYKNEVYAATENGLYKEAPSGKFEKVIIKYKGGEALAYFDVRGAAFAKDGTLWIATPAGVVRKLGNKVKLYTGKDGVPYTDFTVVKVAPNGTIWFGTNMGAVLFNGNEWGYRQGLGWLPNDKINDIYIDSNNNVWFATEKGIGEIYYKKMTLAQKAVDFEKFASKLKRTKYGYVNGGHLKKAGDLKTLYLTDSDNDGQWTGEYGAGECFAYAATGKEIYKQNAMHAFKAMKFLQDVTQLGIKSQRPPVGFIARAIRSTTKVNPNIGCVENDKKEQKSDKLWKVINPRWPKTVDGKWWWKSDTSTDELDGHFFFYGAYYSLVCKTPAEKQEVREVVRKLMDHIISHDYTLVDWDGKRTRFAVLGPDVYNHSIYWFQDRGLNSLSLLSYLTVAEHVTNDPKYTKVINYLIKKEGYLINAMKYKLEFGFGSGTQFDDEMAFLNFYNIMHYSKNKALKEAMGWSSYMAYRLVAPKINPLYNFIYSSYAIGRTFTDPWGTYKIDPWKGWLSDSVYTLEHFPMNHVIWGNKNSQRADIINLPRQQVQDITEDTNHSVNLKTRGYRTNKKVIPIENNLSIHWDNDPWQLDNEGNGTEVSDPTMFLLPYYMGLYYKFL
ncbi:MAG TPA: two-component regulator propeller domain-containing protein [Victivallales bacterium]|nr:two-component regulator propeller domain-containing protein [Victivallales bacterium]